MSPSPIEMLSIAEIAVVAAAAFVAGAARGFSGFGAALIFIPLASAVVGPKAAAATLLVTDAVLTLGMLPAAWRCADRVEVANMAVGALAGVPLGTLALTLADPVGLRWSVCLLALLLLAFLMSGWRYHGRPRAGLAVAVGGVAGLFSGVAQLGGPPVVAYWLSGVGEAVTVRANVILYFAVSTVISLTSYAFGGLFDATIVRLCVFAAPSYALGLRLGAQLYGRAEEHHFRRVCYVLIAAAAVLGLPLLDVFWMR